MRKENCTALYFVLSVLCKQTCWPGEGQCIAGMGVDAVNYDRSGQPSIIVTNFSDQMLALYHRDDNGIVTDLLHLPRLGGWDDIFVADGHIEADIEQIQKRISYAELPHLLHNLGIGKFEEVTASMGDEFAVPIVARGAAYADIENDGALDLLMTTNGGRAYLFHNEGTSNYSLRIKLQRTKSNRDGIGAVVRVTSGSEKQWKTLRSGSSYLSQSELVLIFGLGAANKAYSVKVDWPSGRVDKLTNVDASQTINYSGRERNHQRTALQGGLANEHASRHERVEG